MSSTRGSFSVGAEGILTSPCRPRQVSREGGCKGCPGGEIPSVKAHGATVERRKPPFSRAVLVTWSTASRALMPRAQRHLADSSLHQVITTRTCGMVGVMDRAPGLFTQRT